MDVDAMRVFVGHCAALAILHNGYHNLRGCVSVCASLCRRQPGAGCISDCWTRPPSTCWRQHTHGWRNSCMRPGCAY